jgi:hypothetical protein
MEYASFLDSYKHVMASTTTLPNKALGSPLVGGGDFLRWAKTFWGSHYQNIKIVQYTSMIVVSLFQKITNGILNYIFSWLCCSYKLVLWILQNWKFQGAESSWRKHLQFFTFHKSSSDIKIIFTIIHWCPSPSQTIYFRRFL